MKPIHKRLYTVLPRPAVVASSTASSSQLPLPRVRSNSASSSRTLYTSSHLSFLDAASQQSPPPQTSRGNPNVIVGTRLAAEVRAEIEGHTTNPSSQQHSGHLPYSLALTLGQSDSSSHLPLLPYNPFLPYQALSPLLVYSAKSDPPPADARKKRHRARYHLDVGAYGIPKRSRGPCVAVAGRDGHGRFDVRSEPHHEELSRAVQVGEDAYFVRDNAMGVADGVGGWSRLRRTANAAEPSPSALFARRLMHYCSEEVDAAASEQEHFVAETDGFSETEEGFCAELEDSLDELEEGLDVLMILERAYEKALRSHVCRADQSSTSVNSRSSTPSDGFPDHKHPPNPSCPPSSAAEPSRVAPSTPELVPLFEGSSTALVAILEHPTSRSTKSSSDSSLFNPQPSKPDRPEVSTDGAVIRIAHLGDCMGMLIRGEEVVWRTEEMWWNFNTPVQLGPTSATKPHDARTFTIPVQEDDVLILASDGLSDNLWDSEILDEVVRFRRSFMGPLSESREETDRAQEGARGGMQPSMVFRRSTLAGMLSEALCSRAKRVSETRSSRRPRSGSLAQQAQTPAQAEKKSPSGVDPVQVGHDVPFARRAREQGKLFEGGKPDDISVLVAVISPVEQQR